jgi:hypothetical protein
MAWLSGQTRVTCETNDHWASRQKGGTMTPTEKREAAEAAAAALAAEAATLKALTPAKAKDEGNRLFKLQRLDPAIAHYAWAGPGHSFHDCLLTVDLCIRTHSFSLP